MMRDLLTARDQSHTSGHPALYSAISQESCSNMIVLFGKPASQSASNREEDAAGS
jgi:hypothetical protein